VGAIGTGLVEFQAVKKAAEHDQQHDEHRQRATDRNEPARTAHQLLEEDPHS
jgi:hypothetical protein